MCLPKDIRWDFVAVLCIANQNELRGFLPDDNTIAFKMRTTVDEWVNSKKILIEKNLIYETDDGYTVTGWDEKQYESDDSAERVKKYRGKKETGMKRPRNGDVTPPEQSRTDTDTDTDSDTEQIQNITDSDSDQSITAAPPCPAPTEEIPKQQKLYKFTLTDTEREDLQIFGYLHCELKEITAGKPVDELTWLAGRVIKYKRGQIIQDVPFVEALARAVKNLQSEEWFVKSGGLYWLLDVKAGKYNGENACVRIGKYMNPAMKRDGPKTPPSLAENVARRLAQYMEYQEMKKNG